MNLTRKALDEVIMPLYDFKCSSCGNVFEGMNPIEISTKECPQCGEDGERIISFGHGGYLREEAPWLPSVLNVVDKQSRDPATRAFISDPTRKNYKLWMKSQGIRPLEDNEKPSSFNEHEHTQKCVEKIMEVPIKDIIPIQKVQIIIISSFVMINVYKILLIFV